MDIAEFLTARWDEEERIARAAAIHSRPRDGDNDGSTWRVSDDADVYCAHLPLLVGPWETNVGQEVAEHIGLHDPARVLADLEAKRAILAWHLGPNCPRCPYGEAAQCPTIGALLRIHRDHPDFDPAWVER